MLKCEILMIKMTRLQDLLLFFIISVTSTSSLVNSVGKAAARREKAPTYLHSYYEQEFRQRRELPGQIINFSVLQIKVMLNGKGQ